jgi:hypothetical protein
MQTMTVPQRTVSVVSSKRTVPPATQQSQLDLVGALELSWDIVLEHRVPEQDTVSTEPLKILNMDAFGRTRRVITVVHSESRYRNISKNKREGKSFKEGFMALFR